MRGLNKGVFPNRPAWAGFSLAAGDAASRCGVIIHRTKENTPSDSVLVEQCLAGSKEAFETLVIRHQDRVYHMAWRILRDQGEAADLTQETFIQAYRKLETFNPEYRFLNWILTICVNRGKNRLRGRARRHRAHQAYGEHQMLFPPHSDSLRLELDQALERIPEVLRIPLVLKHVEGLSYEEVAQVLEIGISAAKMRVKRGRDMLVEILCPGEEPSVARPD